MVAHAVSRAVNSTRPRRRYTTPLDAKALIFIHWLLPTFAWEALVRMAVQSAASKARQTL